MSYEIDTHALIKRLMAKNFTEEQAEEIVKITKEVRQGKLDRMATKRDLREYYYKTIITAWVNCGCGWWHYYCRAALI